MMRKKISSCCLLFLLMVISSCVTSPVIETRHRPIPHVKKYESPANINTKKAPPVNVANDNIAVFNKALEEARANEAKLALDTKNKNAVSVSMTALTSSPSALASSSTAVRFQDLALDLKTENRLRSTENIPTDSKKIGLILPLTGKNGGVGQRALNAIRLAFGLNDSTVPNSFSLAIFDNQSNPEMAIAGVEKLMREDNVVAIMGGLSSREATIISTRAEYYQVPFISFSQKSGITQNTEFTFRNSVTAEMQVERLVKYATEGLGAKKFAILYPNDSYGVEFANKYWDLVLAAGGQITAAQVYDPKDSDFNIYIQKLVGTYYPEARAQEYKQRLDEIAFKQKKKLEANPNKKKSLRENEAKENILSPIVNFDVLFVPDSSKALGQVVAFMKANDVSDITYLGTNIWNSPDLIRRIGSGKESVYFVDSIPTPEEVARSSFHNKYISVYQEAPSLVEAQFYESASILRDTLANTSLSRDGLANQLKILGRKSGAYNEIRMNNSHEIERPLNIFGLANGEILKSE